MKKCVFLLGVIAGITPIVSAATMCSPGSLASYIALGNGGCSIGSSTVSMFRVLPGISGGTPIDAANVNLTPTVLPNGVSLAAQVTASASANQLFEALFNYSITGMPFQNASIALTNSSATGDGGVTDIQNLCNGGNFGPNGVTGCAGPTRTQVLLNSGTATTSFAVPWTTIGVTDDLTIDGGLAGTATGGTITDTFTVPEPSSIVLVGLGLALAAYQQRRRVGQKS